VGLAIATRITHGTNSHQHELVIIACTGGGIFVVLILVSIVFVHLRGVPTHQLLLSTTIITIIILVKAFFYHQIFSKSNTWNKMAAPAPVWTFYKQGSWLAYGAHETVQIELAFQVRTRACDFDFILISF
jgi:hypothetical protein